MRMADSLRAREETRQRILAERRDAPRYLAGQGQPTKKQRRALMAFKEQFCAPEGIEDLDLEDWG